MATAFRSVFRALTPLLFFLCCVVAQMSCTCSREPVPPPPGLIACEAHSPSGPVAPPLDPTAKTVVPGATPGTFSVSSAGDATYVMRLDPVPGRAGVDPKLAVVHGDEGRDGILGVGFSLAGVSSITRCPQNLSRDGEIRDVRFDASDKLCLDNRRLIPVGESVGEIEYRTLPDTFVKVIGYYPADAEAKTPNNALFFEAHLPSGLVVEYGSGDGGKPLAAGGVPRAFLATKARDTRGNAMTYSYCFADREGYTAEYALTEIKYTSFEGTPSLEPTRAVRFVYGARAPVDARIHYARGMALQSSLQLSEIQMFAPGDELVRRYGFTYAQSPTTRRTLLTQIEECAGDGACKPPTRFQYKSSGAGFKDHATSIAAPTSKKASPMLFDMDGDGLDDLVVPDTDPALSTPQNPITRWLVSQNKGAGASPPELHAAKLGFSQEWVFVDNPSEIADPALIRPELGTALDYDQDGRTDVLLQDIYGSMTTWHVLLAQEGGAFELLDTGVRRPFPLGLRLLPSSLGLIGAAGSSHLADVDGDHVPDLLQCDEHDDAAGGDPSMSVWRVHLWRPARGGVAAGFDPEGERIETLAGERCGSKLYTTDLNADGKVDLVMESIVTFSDGTELPAENYYAFTRKVDGTWEVFNTYLPVVTGRVLFLDVNGDGLPDAVQSGYSDHALRTYTNTGAGFSEAAVLSIGPSEIGEQDRYFQLAVPFDHNGDGGMDVLMPVPGGTLPDRSNVLPAWVILQANAGLQQETTFSLVDPHVPFEAEVAEAILPADPRGPRVGDLNGDGAADLVLPLGGVLHIFENLAPDQDVLSAVSDGMNDHDPTEPGFVPNVSISYGHLSDPSITSGAAPDHPALESALYLSRSDPSNGCAYPRRCVVGPRRVVSGYAVNDGSGGARRFSVRYRDGRYDRLGPGFVGFAERIVTDLDTLASTKDVFDNVTFNEDLKVYPFAGQAKRQWRWNPGLPTQPDPDQIELSFLDTTPTFVPTSDGKTYFTLATERRSRRAQGVYPPPQDPSKSAASYAAEIESKGGAAILRDTTATVADFDEFGNVLTADLLTSGVDLTLHIERTFKNDTDRWVVGQLQTEKACSAAAMQSRCRMLTRTTTVHGEVESETTDSDDKSPETSLSVVFGRDAFGNITEVTAEDAHGHRRSSSTVYDAEGIFPTSEKNAAGHTTELSFDTRLGVLERLVDPNQLVTAWAYDGFRRLVLEKRPDGSQTTLSRSRTKEGGGGKGVWRFVEKTTASGGADDVVEYDSLDRPVRLFSHGPDTPEEPGAPPRLMQVIAYDRHHGKVARRSVPTHEGTPESELLFDVDEYDALGREVLHRAPWNATTKTEYTGLTVKVTDPLQNVTVTETDALGRPLTITDAKLGKTEYTYGPFGTLYTVKDPGGAITRTTRDAFGRVRKLDDPDRGPSVLVHDGFGELISLIDALGRKVSFEYDELGRPKSRTDALGAEVLTTTWTWDTAANGLGKLHKLTSPDGEKTYAYNNRGQLERLTLSIQGEGEPLSAGLTYDDVGRVATIAYPTPSGASPFVVAHDYDAHGYLLTVRDNASNLGYWRLTGVDNAGRFRKEMFGNGAVTERSYFADKQRLKSIVTHGGGKPTQKLSYTYDAGLNLKSRTDELQPQNTTERFRYDALERLTCAYFSDSDEPSAPCDLSYGYAPSGNLTFKSDIGVLAYGAPTHPHAVTSAGGESYSYDAVGNQITRPGGVIVSYTPFDLPKAISQGASAVTFGYDGDQQRIRKTTPTEETLYFGDLYERVTEMATALTEHRYYIHSPERVVAVKTRGGKAPSTRYVHVDHLGSVDALTNEGGGVVERRSYDPFGQRRNPVWGQPPPASFSSKTTKGFTGHEEDSELGLVNAKGRIFDPKLGRFLTVDPIVSRPYSGQSWNAYAWVLNNPLRYVDPSGFQEDEDDGREYLPARSTVFEVKNPDGTIGYEIVVRPLEEEPDDGAGVAYDVGASAPPTDLDTTGSSPEMGSQQTAAPDDWVENPYLQIEGGFLAGLAEGFVPFGGVGHQLLDMGEVLPHGSPQARFGLAFGQVLGGIVTLLGGVTGEVLGGIATTTGIGAAIGVPTIAVSTTFVVGGFANIAAGLAGLPQAMMSQGSGSGGSQGPTPTAGSGVRPSTLKPGPHAGESIPARGPGRDFTPSEAAEMNRIGHKTGCHTCGTTDPGTRSGTFVPDHQPPSALAKPGASQRLYPQCVSCSRRQGGEVNAERVRRARGE